MELKEKNRLIAEFMWYKTYDHTDSTAIILKEGNEFNSLDIGHIHTKFHSSWDWLMPVVNEVYNTGLDEQTTNEIGDITHALLDVNINAVHEAVVKFIQMWNKQK